MCPPSPWPQYDGGAGWTGARCSDERCARGSIGRDAFLRERDKGAPTRGLVQFALEDPQPLAYHEKPIWREGEMVGRATSGMYGHTLGRAIALGYVEHPDGVTPEYVESGRREIEIACERSAARASLRPMYDPRSERIKA